MSVINRYGAKGRVVDVFDGVDVQAIVLWDAAPDGRNAECWVEVRQEGLLLKEMHGPVGWTLAEAREVAHSVFV